MNVMACEARYGRYVSDRIVRRVWAAISRDPQITVRALAKRMGYRTWTDVSLALKVLRDAGYIDFKDRSKGARQILVPFVVTGKKGKR